MVKRYNLTYHHQNKQYPHNFKLGKILTELYFPTNSTAVKYCMKNLAAEQDILNRESHGLSHSKN